MIKPREWSGDDSPGHPREWSVTAAPVTLGAGLNRASGGVHMTEFGTEEFWEREGRDGDGLRLG